jgi:hypothetical protein
MSEVSVIDAALDYWEWVEYAAEAFVILGCAGEYVSEFTHIKTEEWRHRLSKVSLIILTVALAIELGALVRTNNLSGQEIALLNNESAKANNEAAKANQRAAELESMLGPRRLTADQKKKTKLVLEKFSGIPIDLYFFEGDEWTRFETSAFIEQLSAAMDSAGIDTRVRWGAGCLIDPPLIGVAVNISEGASEHEISAARAVDALFTEIGIDKMYFPRDMPVCRMFAAGAPDPKKPLRKKLSNIKVIVGSKPPAMLARPTVYDAIRSGESR